ncbi:uncharacterized protein LOC133185438 [Saccostrea echinata]|uniref:uncharacterized protein LOC133185438 n=1 Tax=Saccostrea echinata TaxID=191078 RepID=UPI002A83AA4D|nr:uncharacterized protein LOC133185438 [Saccostrea echinata]
MHKSIFILGSLLGFVVFSTEASLHKTPEHCEKTCHLDHVGCSSTCRKQHMGNRNGFLDCSKTCKFTYSACSEGCLPKGFSNTPIVEAGVTTQATIPDISTAKTSPTSVCLKACSVVRTGCQNECNQDPEPGCLPECTTDYDDCVQECGTSAVESSNIQTTATNSTNQQKRTCLVQCSIENVECMVGCQTDVTDTSCLTECPAELAECQKECNDQYPETNAAGGSTTNTVDTVQVEIMKGTQENAAQTGKYNVYTEQVPAAKRNSQQSTDVNWVDPSNTNQVQPYSIHSTCVKLCATEQSGCQSECAATDPSCRTECTLEYDECITECNQDYGQNKMGQISGKSNSAVGIAQRTGSISISSAPKAGTVAASAATTPKPNAELVIQTVTGEIKTSASKPMSMLKLLCLSSCVITRNSCLADCKIGTPEVGCSTECYEDNTECITDCNKEEIERQKEKLEKQLERASETGIYNIPDNKADKVHGTVKISSTKPMSALKLICQTSCMTQKNSCLNDCKIGIPEVGCSTECYDDHRDCVKECNEDELERQKEKLEKQLERASETGVHETPYTNFKQGAVRISSTKPMSLLKMLCQRSCDAKRNFCVDDCKVSTPEVGCSAECYTDHRECVAECNEDEVKRQIERLEKQKEQISNTDVYNYLYNDMYLNHGGDYDYGTSSNSNEG